MFLYLLWIRCSLELSKKTGGGGLCLVSICFWKKNSRFGLNKAETCLSCRAVTGAIQQKKSNSRIFTGLFLPEFSHSCACHMLCDTSDLCWLTNGKTLSLHFFNAFFPSLEKSVTVEPILFKNIKHLSFPEYVDVNAIWIVVFKVRTHILTVKRETGWKQNKSTFNEADENFQKKQKTLSSAGWIKKVQTKQDTKQEITDTRNMSECENIDRLATNKRSSGLKIHKKLANFCEI